LAINTITNTLGASLKRQAGLYLRRPFGAAVFLFGVVLLARGAFLLLNPAEPQASLCGCEFDGTLRHRRIAVEIGMCLVGALGIISGTALVLKRSIGGAALVIWDAANAAVQPRPFRLAVASTVILIGGLGALLIYLAALTKEELYYTPAWQYAILKIIPCLAATIASASLWVGVRSLRRSSHLRTSWNYVCLGSAGVSIVLVIGMVANWAMVERALSIFTRDGGWAAFGDHPAATGIVGIVTSPNDLIPAFLFIHSTTGVSDGTVTGPEGCFALDSPPGDLFGVTAHEYQKLQIQVGTGYFRASIKLSPVGITEPSKLTAWTKISAFQFIKQEITCAVGSS